jgi:hypothetical protein
MKATGTQSIIFNQSCKNIKCVYCDYRHYDRMNITIFQKYGDEYWTKCPPSHMDHREGMDGADGGLKGAGRSPTTSVPLPYEGISGRDS